MGFSYRFVVSDAIWDFQFSSFSSILSCLIDSQGLLLSVLSQFCLILSVFTPNERASPNGFLPVSQREAFWVFDIVSLRLRLFGFLTSFHQMRAFYVFGVFCSVYTITCVLDPYEHFIPF